ncbi:MAG: AbrB/MazE/SpoVT family DNA-binding domain-containing protein [Proteobacteria bacterium]|nr:AbrB/MazE/SpoVT family DNA-binding domain-containing protein [Pseudomonadota bacterium]
MTTIQVNERGSLTLPKSLRKALGIARGGVVMVELSREGLVLKPAVSFPIELYRNERVDEFDKADRELGRYLKSKRKRR